MWTRFMDMHSGGSLKEPQQYIYIEAPQDEAVVVFYNRFRHNPSRVTCTCCGDDYSISQAETLELVTAYERSCRFVEDRSMPGGGEYVDEPKEPGELGYSWNPYMPLGEYMQRKDVLIIFEKSIKPSQRIGTVPEQGYVWKD